VPYLLYGYRDNEIIEALGSFLGYQL